MIGRKKLTVWCALKEQIYGKPLWTKLLRLPHTVQISSRATSIPKTYIKFHIKHNQFKLNTKNPYQTQYQNALSNSIAKTRIKPNTENPYQT